MQDFHKFIDGFKNFRRYYYDAEVDYYAALRDGQHPKALVIACSDSRADPALLMGCDPGDIFVVRNVANLVPHAAEAGRGDAVLASVLCGAVVDTLLVLNNYRDREQDRRHGKRTLIVRFGERFGLYLYLVLGLSVCWFCLVFAVGGHVWAAVLPQVYLVLHIRAWRRMVRIRRGRGLNAVLGLTGRNILLFSLLLSAGFLLGAAGRGL